MCFVTVKCPNDHQLSVITDHFRRCGSWGIPSAWRSPTARQPGGSPRRDRCVRRVALLPGWRVVALEGGRGDAHPAHLAQRQQFWWLAIPEVCPPGEGTVVEIDKIFWETKQPS
jgi:hypothetical protein